MASFTPGPWRTIRWHDGSLHVAPEGASEFLPTEADQALIAAAPDLYAALAALLPGPDALYSEIGSTREKVERARAAIAKADGRG